MPVTVSVEERVLDTLMAALAVIGTGNLGWLTQTSGITVQKKVPGDPLPEPTKPAVYVQWDRTSMIDAESATTATNRWRVTVAMWCTGGNVEAMLNAKRDVCFALYNAEGAFSSAFGGQMHPDQFVYQSDMESTGIAVGLLTAYVDTTVDHNTP